MARAKNDGRGRIGGRVTGTPNKVTKKLRDLISQLTEDEFKTFKKNLKQCKPADACKIYIDLCKFVLPSLSAVDINDITETKSKFSDALKDMRDSIEEES